MSTKTTDHEVPGAYSVLTMSTLSFTLMFAVWLMFGILGKPIQEEFGLDKTQIYWVSSVAVLNGSMWRLPSGILADRFGGKVIMTIMMILGAVASLGVSMAPGDNYALLLVLAFCVGIVGNSFSSGIAWTSAWFSPRRKGFALGVFGAGNVGASVTKIIGPGIIAATAGTTVLGFIPGGWRLIPIIYAVLLTVTAVLTWFICPTPDRAPGASERISAMLTPLKQIRVWRFSLYYVIVFGAYVAFSAILPLYYQDVFKVSLGTAALLTTTFIFPASLLRPLGGWFSDKWGARTAMYLTFVPIGAFFTVLSIPSGVDEVGNAYGLPLWLVVVLVFLVGCLMGIGKAAVYKHIPTYFPDHVGSVGGLVGMLGGLGGFFLPPAFAYIEQWTGWTSTPFIVMTVITGATLIWMHMVIRGSSRQFADGDPTSVR